MVDCRVFSLLFQWNDTLIEPSSFPVDVQGQDAFTFPELQPLFLLSVRFKIDTLTMSVATTIIALDHEDADVAQ